MRRSASERLAAHAGGGSRRALRSRPVRRCCALTLIRLAADRHRLVLTNHHILMDGWSMPVLVQELLTLYAQRGRCGRAAAGDALPRLSGVDRAGRIAPRAGGLARDAWRGWKRPTRLAPPDPRPCAGRARADHAGAERAADRGAEPAGAPARADAQHLHPGGLGDPARPADRARRRGVRRDGGGPAAGDCRHRAHGGAVHQHAAAAGAAAAGASRCIDLLQAGAGQPVAADGAPASRAWPRSRGWPGLGELFDTLVVFENYPVDRGGLAAEAGGLRISERQRDTMPRIIR